jgi:acid phosphatase type 7
MAPQPTPHAVRVEGPTERLRLVRERWQSLAYCSCLESSRPMRPGGSNPSRSARASVLAVLALAASVDGAAAEPENGAITFAGRLEGKPVIYMSDPDSSALRVIPTRGWAGDPAASPGGRRIAFTRRGSVGAQIWTAYTDGSSRVQLTTGPSDFEPGWSPPGDAVAFARGAAGARDIYRVRSDGTELRRLTLASRDDRSPDWSVRGRIAFVRHVRGSGGDIYDIAASGGRPRRLTRGPADDRSPAWSPTGGRVVFARGRSGRGDLHLVRPGGSGERRLTALPGDETDPAWSPDGRWVVFVHSRAGRRRLYRLRMGRRAVSDLDSRRLSPVGSSRAQPRSPHWQPAGLDPVVAAAGDIACDPADRNFADGFGAGAFCRQRQTSDLLLRMDLDAILTPGDIQYEDGQLWKFQQSFDPTWGRLKPLIRPVPGNHEYGDPGAAGYFDYFNGPGQQSGPAGGRDQGYYSFDVGRWHMIALNSECARVGGCAAGSPQESWLRADLATHPAACTLAFWHRPRFTSGRNDAAGAMLPVWNALYEAGADVIVNGHEHFYERFAPLTPAGVYDPGRGIRQFIAGTGGRSRFGYVTVAPGSEVRENRRSGVLKLTLEDEGYRWEFVSAPDGRVHDSGTDRCR